jgi:copper transport protein
MIPNPTPFVQWLTSDSDGNVWLAEQRGHALGVITSKINPSPIPSAPPSTAKRNEGVNLFLNYNILVAPAIPVGLVLVAFMYVKNFIDIKQGEKLLNRYKKINSR